jgi:hypothetical protein
MGDHSLRMIKAPFQRLESRPTARFDGLKNAAQRARIDAVSGMPLAK